jgi:hypothetical protein
MKQQMGFQFKKFFVTALVAVAASASLPVIAGTMLNGSLVQVQTDVIATATRPDGFYIIVNTAVDPGGMTFQGTTTPTSCSNKWVFVPKDAASWLSDPKIYRDTINSVQLAIALGKKISIVSGHCYKNYEVTPAAPLNPYNFPVVYGIDVAW